MVPAEKPRAWEMEAIRGTPQLDDESEVQGQPGLHKILSQRKKRKKNS